MLLRLDVLAVLVSVALLVAPASRAAASGPTMRALIEADYLEQAKAITAPRGGRDSRSQVRTFQDAAGAVDGVKNGKHAFHTAQEPNPWWQVDLGKLTDIARIVVFNRLDYKPGLHNADRLVILTSQNGKSWAERHRNEEHFGGISGARPLDVRIQKGQVQARYVRLQVPSSKAIYFHLDEVEVYGFADARKNLALHRPADQSSVSRWSTSKLPAGASLGAATAFPIGHSIERGRRLATDLGQMGVDTTAVIGELDAAEADLAKLPAGALAADRRAVYLRVRWAVRRLAFRNPLMKFGRLLVCKRFTQDTYPDVCLNHMPWVSTPGGDLCVVTLAGPDGEPQVRNVINGQLGPGHVHGMDLWFDARRVVFGYARKKTPDGPRDRGRRNNFKLRREVEPTHIFEIGIDGKNLRQLTRHRDWSDLDPTYLPSGDIAFVSERCGYSLQCNEWDKDETSCNLYVMKPDGSDIRRLSASKDGDYLPHCLSDGTIGYTRWEYQERGWAHIQSIWYVRPNGTGADALFKQHLNDPWALEDVRSIPGTDPPRLMCIATGHHTLAMGPVVIVTPSDGMNASQSIRIVTPGVKPPEGGMSGRAVDEGGVADDGGLYSTPWPLSRKYFLASYSYSTRQTDKTGFGVYLIDVFGTKELIYRDPAISCFIPIPLLPRPKPPVLPDTTEQGRGYAVCALSDATLGCEGIEPGRAKYLRIAQRLPWPYDNMHGGQRYAEKARPNNWTPARILGDVPLARDGSAHFRVPADQAVYFQLLDENRMELRRMRSFISFQPGEQRGCVGCHETRETAPAGKPTPLALLREAVLPTPLSWGTRPVSFLREIQPIFDRHCVGCHSGMKPSAGLDFFGGLTSGGHVADYGHNVAFDTIIRNRLVAWSPVQGDASITQPLQFGSHRSKLVHVLREGACSRRVALSKDEWYRLVAWIDANAPYHDGFADKRPQRPVYDIAGDRALLRRLRGMHAQRCGGCHKVDQVVRLDWISVLDPEQSLMLTAPLAKSAGGTQKCGQAAYASRDDLLYRAALQAIGAAVRDAMARPRRDLKALMTTTAPAELQ
ncbi:discoidin domain-containing protein [bacterium]|nr:discoidin domain-containing protein [bacterium]